MKNQYEYNINYLDDLNTEFEGYFRKSNIDELHALKELTVDFITTALDAYPLKTGLKSSTVALLNLARYQHQNETDEHYQKRIKYLSIQVAELWQNDIRAKWRRISDITASKDRIKKLIQLLIAIDYSLRSNNLLKDPLTLPIVGNFKTTSSINEQLRTYCSRITSLELAEIEKYEPYFSASFSDNDFVHFVEQRAQQLDSITYLHGKLIKCIYNSLTHLDSFRIYTEFASMQGPDNKQEKYNEAVEEYNKYKINLVKIKKNLAGINSPKKAKIKEFITQHGFAINAKTGADILLNARGQAVEKGIKRIIKTTEKETSRKKDKQIEKTFIVYDFINTSLNPCDFIEHKTDTINNLVNDFLASETATEIIASSKDLEYIKNKRQASVRMPKPTTTAIEKLADDNNITQQLLLNIIIQYSSEEIQASGQSYYNQTIFKKTKKKKASLSSAEIPLSNTERPTSSSQPEGNTPMSPAIKGQPLFDKESGAIESKSASSSPIKDNHKEVSHQDLLQPHAPWSAQKKQPTPQPTKSSRRKQ